MFLIFAKLDKSSNFKYHVLKLLTTICNYSFSSCTWTQQAVMFFLRVRMVQSHKNYESSTANMARYVLVSCRYLWKLSLRIICSHFISFDAVKGLVDNRWPYFFSIRFDASLPASSICKLFSCITKSKHETF